MTEQTNSNKLFEGKPVTDTDLQKIREDLPKDKRLIEVKPNEYKVLVKLNE
jgi:hypothetical protein